MTKTRNGEGSIRPRQTNAGIVYDVQLTVHNRRSGLSERIFKGGFSTEKAAVAWRNTKMRASEAGAIVNAKPITIPELVRAWMAATPGREPSTVELYNSTLKNHISTRLNIRVTSLTESVLKSFMASTPSHLGPAGRGGESTNTAVLIMISAAFRWGSRPSVGLVEANPMLDMDRVSRPRAKRREAMPLPLVGALLAAAGEQPSGIIWALLAATGARRGEILGLNWEDVDLAAGTVSFNKISSPETGGRGLAKRTKGKEDRKVHLPTELLARLGTLASEGMAGHQPLIPGPRGGRLCFSTMRAWWDRDCAVAGIRGYVPHCLRHTWATTALAEGVPANVVSSVLGHSTVNTTLTIYAHESEIQKASAVDVVANALIRSA